MVIFKRRNPLPLKQILLKIFWPTIGFKRTFRYIILRIKRLRGTPYALACGLANGIAVSFSPFLGAHVLLAIFLTFIMRGSVFASLLGTIFGNPWTLPFFIAFEHRIGQMILDRNVESISTAPVVDQAIAEEVSKHINVSTLFSDPSVFFAGLMEWNFFDKFLIPTLVGSIPLMLIMWIISYSVCYVSFLKLQGVRSRRLERKLAKENYYSKA